MRTPKGILTLGLLIFSGATSVLACTPPNYPPDWKFPTWSETVATSYANAEAVLMVEVVKVNLRKTPRQGFPEAGIERAYVRPIKTYKGSTTKLPEFFEFNYSGTTCDRPSGLIAGTKPIVFLAPTGELSLTVGIYNSYADTVKQLEQLGR